MEKIIPLFKTPFFESSTSMNPKKTEIETIIEEYIGCCENIGISKTAFLKKFES